MASGMRDNKPMGLTPKRIGRYVVDAPIGWGAAAVVYRARNANGQVVALKVLRPEAAAHPALRASIQNEYRTLSRLRHPGIVRVFDGGEANGLFYMAMEYIEGETLEEFLQRVKLVGEETAIRIGRQVAEALDYLHRQGYVHRDIKTSNILLTPTGRAVLFDFGTVRSIHDPPPAEQGIYGTPAFLAPEQIEPGQPVDGRADLYSLGVVLYRMVTGRKPFYGSRGEVLDAHLHQPPPPPSDFHWVSPELEQVILKALAKAPAERYQSGADLALALASVKVMPVEPKPPLARRIRQWLQETVTSN